MASRSIRYSVMQDGRVRLAFEKDSLTLHPVCENILRITRPSGEARRFTAATEGFTPERPAVDMGMEGTSFVLKTPALTARVDPEGRVDMYTPAGGLLCADYRGEFRRAETLSARDRELAALEGHAAGDADGEYAFQIVKALEGDECFYGLGDKTGFLNKRGYDYVMWNTDNPRTQMETREFRALYKSIPFVIVLKQTGVYGLFWDNPHKLHIDLGYADNRCWRMEAADGPLEYYYIAGASLSEVVSAYTRLTGRPPLPPLWTLGYHQSRWSYASAGEVREIAGRLREYDIPCDAIHLDIDYMERFKVFTWDKERFPAPKNLLAELKEQGFKTVTIVDPGVKKEAGYPVYEEGVRDGHFLKDTDGAVYENTVWPGISAFPDFSRPQTRDWWGGLVRRWLEGGIDGIWNDMNEPASFNGPLPDDLRFDGEGEGALHRDMHNLYGHLMAKATAAAFEQAGRRPYVITRACYSGSQRYTTAWTGDNQSLWAHLQMSIPQLCNLGLSGMPMVGCDVGGFGENVTPELMARWVEAACLTPFFRNHCASGCRRQEPWRLGDEVLAIYRRYVRLRYRLLPYLYDRLREASQTGLPLMRPLVMEYGDDPATHNLNDEYLVGTALLAAPVTGQGKTMKMVYLPAGDWVDFWTGESRKGGRTILREAPLDVLPLYVRKNSILPLYPQGMAYIGDQPPEELVLAVYGRQASYTHYQDAGQGLAYQNGEYNLYRLDWKEGRLTISLEHAGYTPYRRFIILWDGQARTVEPAAFPCVVPLEV